MYLVYQMHLTSVKHLRRQPANKSEAGAFKVLPQCYEPSVSTGCLRVHAFIKMELERCWVCFLMKGCTSAFCGMHLSGCCRSSAGPPLISCITILRAAYFWKFYCNRRLGDERQITHFIKGNDKGRCSTPDAVAFKRRTSNKNTNREQITPKIRFIQSFFQLKWFTCSSFVN